MINSYFTTAIRALKRNWNYTVINVVGLTFGLACCLVLFLAIRYELSYDRHHTNADRTYRMITYSKNSGSNNRNTGIPLPVLAALHNDFPALKGQLTMVYELLGTLVRVGDKKASKFQEESGVVAFVEPAYFNLFDYHWKEGNPQTALNSPSSVVLSERMARKYFGNADAVGKRIRLDNKLDFTVTGVVENPPATSSLPFEVLLSFTSLKSYGADTGWDEWESNYSGAQIYMTLPTQSAQVAMERQLVSFVRKYMKPEQAKDLHYELQPLKTIHSDTRTGNFANRTVSPTMIWAMGLIGLFILIAACVNFINLATAQAIRRAKEVGVRKVLGSSRSQLVRQFLGETGLLTALAVGLAFLLASGSLPYVAELLDIKADSLTLLDPVVIGFMVLLTFFTTVLAGFYPALVLSGYQPVLALRGRMRMTGNRQLTLRRGLIVFQFAISQLLIIGTIIAYSQIDYFRSADLGYSKESVLMLNVPEQKPGQLERLKASLMALPNVKSLSFGMSMPSSNGNWWNNFRYDTAQKDADFGVVMRFADTAYLNTYGLKLVAGRMYHPGDTTQEVVVNESFVRKVGVREPQQILGKFLSLSGRSPKKPIVGVVKDFNTFSLHQETNPSVLANRRDAYTMVGIKLTTKEGGPAAIHQLISAIETNWNATFPDFVMKYQFLDDALASFYKGEERMYSLFRLLAGIAIFIGCLGLYGVVAFMAESRTKEVGIRKVLGASVGHIFGLFSVDFVKLVLVALVLSSPLAWYIMDKWLADFSYKIDIKWWMFALAGALAVVIALLTVSVQSIRVALMNPVKSLRSE